MKTVEKTERNTSLNHLALYSHGNDADYWGTGPIVEEWDTKDLVFSLDYCNAIEKGIEDDFLIERALRKFSLKDFFRVRWIFSEKLEDNR